MDISQFIGRTGRTGWLLLAVAALMCGACSGGSAPQRSSTPRLTAGSDGPLAAGLVSAQDLRTAGLAPDVQTSSLDDTRVFADPDPRGPCGAKVPQLDLADAAAVAIKSTAVQGVELLVRADEATAKAYLDPRVQDAKAGCPEFETTTNDGAAQRVKLDRVIALTSGADESLATQQALLVGDRVTSATVIHLRKGAVVAKLTLFAAQPLSDAVVQGLAAAAFDHLASTA